MSCCHPEVVVSWRSVSIGVALGCITACTAGPTAQGEHPAPETTSFQPLPRPHTGGGLAAAETNRECERCHREIASEWRGSLHQRAFVEPAYQRALQREPLPFCRACHAPESVDLAADPPSAIAALGVGCVTCHGAKQILAGPRPSAAANGEAPHPVVRSAAFAGAGACAGCHEFPFPDEALRGASGAELMQSTITEQAHSPRPDVTCAQCHMPRDETLAHRTHDFRSSRDAAWVRSALDARAARVGQHEVEVTLQPTAVGHAVPTGDLFRRLEVSAEVVGNDYMVLARRERHLTRRWATTHRPHSGFALRELQRDDRPGRQGSTPTRVRFDLGELAASHPVAWRVAYQRVAHP